MNVTHIKSSVAPSFRAALSVAALLLLIFIEPSAALEEAGRVNQIADDVKRDIKANQQVAEELAAMAEREQLARFSEILAMKTNNFNADERAEFIKLVGPTVDEIDSENRVKLKEILSQYAWRKLISIKPHAADNAWMLLQHSNDPKFQLAELAKIKPLVEQGLLDGSRYANLLDNVRLEQGGNQVYGTQLQCTDGNWTPISLEDPNQVDARRKSLGLTAMRQQLADQVAMYGPCPEEPKSH